MENKEKSQIVLVDYAESFSLANSHSQHDHLISIKGGKGSQVHGYPNIILHPREDTSFQSQPREGP